MQNIQENIYVQCVNRVLDYIYLHIDDDLTLKTLAGVAGFSEFHFHRIFKNIVGETLNQFVWRVRVERGAGSLRADPNRSISDVAFDCGFTSLAGFSRAFKARFGLAPTQWDRQSRLQGEKPPDAEFPSFRILDLEQDKGQFPVEIKRIERQRLAYIRVYDSYQVDGRIRRAYDKLMTWYQARGGHVENTTLYGMSMDDPDITPMELCRFDWCVSVPDDWDADGDISIREYPACTIALVSIRGGDLQLEDRVLQYLWRCWLPNSRYQPLDLPGMEIYHRLPDVPLDNNWTDLYLDCAIPVTKFRV